jgi:hypothetical protein
MHNTHTALRVHFLAVLFLLFMIYSNELVNGNFPDSDLGEWTFVNLPFLVATPGLNLFHTYLFPVYTAEENVRIANVYRCGVEFPNSTWIKQIPEDTFEPLQANPFTKFVRMLRSYLGINDNKNRPEKVYRYFELVENKAIVEKEGHCRRLQITKLESDTAAHDYGTYKDALKGARESQISLLVWVIQVSVVCTLIRELRLWSIYTQSLAHDIFLRTTKETWIYEEELSREMIKEAIEVVLKLKVMRDMQKRSMQKRLDRHSGEKNSRYNQFQDRHNGVPALGSIWQMSYNRPFVYRVVITTVIYLWVWISVFAFVICIYMIKVCVST